MTLSLDMAGLVPAVAAAVQAAVVVQQVYCDRRQRGTAAAQEPRVHSSVPAPTAETATVLVQVCLSLPASTSGVVSVHVGGSAGGVVPGAAKEHGPW
ncbi:hypothetical protein [Streptomyces sp. NPDC058667]|uniref:hypothetical protein n=1 Tax=Streptomyces sp. NPDC058667 TaxID=3346588 RepID=UPI0036590368